MQYTETQIEEFWQQHERFLKTSLVTETPHPDTSNLSELCRTDLPQAFAIFKQVELDAIHHLLQYTTEIQQVQQDIATALNAHNKVFLLGCGASGRVAMLLKRLWETYNSNRDKQVICVAAGGDVSLIKSVEEFEDQAEFGITQLIAQGYTNNDLVIGLSASGESPFILAGIEYASKTSQYTPYLICNNPIASILERNPQHILNDGLNVIGISLDVGPMALTGSTRLQATTAMQIVVGLALLSNDTDIAAQIKQIYHSIELVPLEALVPITQAEADILAKNEYVLYDTDNALLGLSLLADITERSPTFNLTPFENNTDKKAVIPANNCCSKTVSSMDSGLRRNDNITQYSPFYLRLSTAANIAEVWQSLFGQQPFCLNWESHPATTTQYMNGFDLSATSARVSGKYLPAPQHVEFWKIKGHTLHVILNNCLGEQNCHPGGTRVCDPESTTYPTCTIPLLQDLLQQTLVYKLCLNSHSTIMMGRLGYFEGNLMLSLKPSNFKLIDRAIRYSQFILVSKYDLQIDYKTIAAEAFKQIALLQANQSIVNNIIAATLAQRACVVKFIT